MDLPIKTPHLLLDDFKLDDRQDLLEIAMAMKLKAQQCPGYFPYYAFADENKNIGIQVADFLIKTFREQKNPNRSSFHLGVYTKSKKLIGGIAVDMKPIWANGKEMYGDIGYFIHPNFGGKGLASEAVIGLLFKYFQKFDSLDLTVHPENHFSLNLVKKIGGKNIGQIEKSTYKNEPRLLIKIDRSDFVKKAYNINQKIIG